MVTDPVAPALDLALSPKSGSVLKNHVISGGPRFRGPPLRFAWIRIIHLPSP